MNTHATSSTGHHWWEARRRRTTAVQEGAGAVGWVFLLLGVLGFIPLFTTGFTAITFAGTGSGAELFGIFHISVLSNLVHLALGMLGLFTSWTAAGSRRYLLAGGLVAALLGLYGFIAMAAGGGNWLPADWAVAALHLGLGVLMIAFGLLLHRRLPKESEARGEGDFGETNRGAAR